MRRRSTARLVPLVLAALALAACTTPDAAGEVQDEWHVDHHDSFDAPALDAGRWTTCFWWGDGGCSITSNDEAEWYEPGQVSVHDGSLDLRADRAVSRHDGRRYSHRSGMVSSGRRGEHGRVRYSFTYGRVEVRFRTPRGAGLWPAIWMLPASNRSLPEIDLMEQYGQDTREASMTLHPTEAASRPDAVVRQHALVGDLSVGWHTVRLDWSERSLRWSIDGVEQLRVSGDRVPSEPMYLVMNLAVGGQAGAPSPTATFPAHLLIDEVTVWKQA